MREIVVSYLCSEFPWLLWLQSLLSPPLLSSLIRTPSSSLWVSLSSSSFSSHRSPLVSEHFPHHLVQSWPKSNIRYRHPLHSHKPTAENRYLFSPSCSTSSLHHRLLFEGTFVRTESSMHLLLLLLSFNLLFLRIV